MFILLNNLWQEAGLVNGSRGVVIDIIYNQGNKLPKFVKTYNLIFVFFR